MKAIQEDQQHAVREDQIRITQKEPKFAEEVKNELDFLSQ